MAMFMIITKLLLYQAIKRVYLYLHVANCIFWSTETKPASIETIIIFNKIINCASKKVIKTCMIKHIYLQFTKK